MFKTKFMSVATLVDCLASAAHAHATDGKVYSASSCVPQKASSAFSIDVAGYVYNDSRTESLRVFCPVINELYSAIDDAWINVRDQSSSSSVVCELVVANQPDGGYQHVIWSKMEYSSGNTSEWQRLYFDPDVVNEISPKSTNSIWIMCDIPPKETSSSAVGNYKVVE